MKKLLQATVALASLMSFAAIAHADAYVYSCATAQGVKSTLVVYSTDLRVDWMPDNGAQTSKANAEKPSTLPQTEQDVQRRGNLEFMLFGFQDQADLLDISSEALKGAAQISAITYTDDDDDAINFERFSCHR